MYYGSKYRHTCSLLYIKKHSFNYFAQVWHNVGATKKESRLAVGCDGLWYDIIKSSPREPDFFSLLFSNACHEWRRKTPFYGIHHSFSSRVFPVFGSLLCFACFLPSFIRPPTWSRRVLTGPCHLKPKCNFLSSVFNFPNRLIFISVRVLCLQLFGKKILLLLNKLGTRFRGCKKALLNPNLRLFWLQFEFRSTNPGQILLLLLLLHLNFGKNSVGMRLKLLFFLGSNRGDRDSKRTSSLSARQSEILLLREFCHTNHISINGSRFLPFADFFVSQRDGS